MLTDTLTTVHVHRLAAVEADRALEDLLTFARRAERALRFYAAQTNYLDGVPMLEDPQTGLLAEPDEGAVARLALGEDYHGAALVVVGN